MKLLLLTDGIFPYVIGGMQKHSYYLGKFLAREGVHVDIVIPASTEINRDNIQNYLTDLERKKIRFLEIDLPNNFYFPGHYIYESYNYSRNIYRMLKADFKNYDFIYAQGYTAWALLKEKKSVDGLPAVGVNFHGIEMYQPSDGVRSYLEKLLLRLPAAYCLKKADVAYSLGGKLTGILEKITSQNHIAETSIGIEKQWLNDADIDIQPPRRFIFIGRYEKRKGIELLNQVISRNCNSNFRFDFIGPIPEHKKIHYSSVVYHGAIYDETRIKKILDHSDVLFCPSYSEGMPTVILEAMARRVAVVATDVGAVSCLVSDKTGWLIEAGNLQQLNDVFLEAISVNSEELQKKKKKAYELIKSRYTWDKVAEINLEVIRQIIKNGSKVN